MRKFKLQTLTAVLLSLFFLAGCIESAKTRKTAQPNDASSQETWTVKLMTYNVHHCNPPSKEKIGTIEIDAITRVIASASPDIVFLQEIDDHNSRSGKDINEAEVIAKQLGMNFCFGKAIDFAGGGYGVAILSKYKLSGSRVYYLPKEMNIKSEQRILLTAELTRSNGRKIRLACTHLDVVSTENRMQQSFKIAEISAQDTLPVILAGDFNDSQKSKALVNLGKTFNLGCSSCLPTVPSDKPTDAIDFILTDKKYHWKVLSWSVAEDTYASDHRPVISELLLK